MACNNGLLSINSGIVAHFGLLGFPGTSGFVGGL